MNPRWIVLLAHGSKDARWRQPFEQLRDRITQRLSGADGHRVGLAYLQFCEPTLDQVLLECRQSGGEEALVIPLFMSGGGHLLRDVPDAVRDAGRRSGVRVRSTGALAEEPNVQLAMVEAVLQLASDSE